MNSKEKLHAWYSSTAAEIPGEVCNMMMNHGLYEVFPVTLVMQIEFYLSTTLDWLYSVLLKVCVLWWLHEFVCEIVIFELYKSLFRCNILMRPHFPVHRRGVHVWNTHLCTPLELCSTSFSMYCATQREGIQETDKCLHLNVAG